MNRTLVAGFFALAVLPTTAFTADASNAGSFLTRTAGIGCRLNANDGEALKVRMMLTNTTGQHLPQGTKVRIGIRYQVNEGSRWERRVTRYAENTLWRDVPANSGIGFDQPSFPRGPHRLQAVSCAASVTIASQVKLDRKTDLQRPRLKLPR